MQRWRRELRGTFSNNSATIPQWELDLEKGEDGGYFGPDSAAWAVHGSMTTLVAGIQSLLIQALHPGALAGVHDHSSYRSDPLGRLAGTIQWIFTISYGDTQAARTASNKVLRIHEYITGSYTANNGEVRPYTANDPDLLRWVHLAFTQAFLATHEAYGAPIAAGADAYVADWAVAGTLMRVASPPTTVAELQAQLAAFSHQGCARRRGVEFGINRAQRSLGAGPQEAAGCAGSSQKSPLVWTWHFADTLSPTIPRTVFSPCRHALSTAPLPLPRPSPGRC